MSESGPKQQMRSRTNQEGEAGERRDGWDENERIWESWQKTKFEEQRDGWSQIGKVGKVGKSENSKIDEERKDQVEEKFCKSIIKKPRNREKHAILAEIVEEGQRHQQRIAVA